MIKHLYLLIILAAPCYLSAQIMTIGDGVVLTIEAGTSLSAGSISSSGTIISDANAKLVIESSSSGSGSLISGGTPNATVRRYIDNNAFHLVTPITSPSNASDFYLGPTNPSLLYSFDEGIDDIELITSIDTALTRPTGFVYWIDSEQGDQTIEFTGTIIDSDVTASLVKTTDGWNLIGNPYPCALDWSSVDAGNTTGTAYFWDSSINGYLFSPGTLPNAIIPMGQGFFVQASTAGDFTIPSANRVHNHSNGFLKSGNTVNDGISNFIRIDLNDGYYGNTVFVGFPDHGTDYFDINGEATKIYSSDDNVQFFAMEDDIELCVNANAPLNEGETKIVPLNMAQVTTGEYTMSFTELDKLQDVSIVLEDLQMELTQDILEIPTYNFSAYVGDDHERFLLHFAWAPNGIEDLGVDLKSDINIYSYGKKIYVKMNDNTASTASNITVYDLFGRIVHFEKTRNSDTEISMHYYQSSYFIVKVMTGNTVYTEKVFIK